MISGGGGFVPREDELLKKATAKEREPWEKDVAELNDLITEMHGETCQHILEAEGGEPDDSDGSEPETSHAHAHAHAHAHDCHEHSHAHDGGIGMCDHEFGFDEFMEDVEDGDAGDGEETAAPMEDA